MNFLVTGVSRTGKSTLAKKLYQELNAVNKNYSLIPFDPFVDSWKTKEMTNQKGDLLECWRELEFSGDCREMIAFTINKLLQKQYDNQQFIFESAHASYDIQHFESLVEKYHMSDLSIIHLVHDDYSVDQLLGKIRDNDDVADWTYHKSNDELRYKLNFALRANKNFRDYLILNDKQFFATSIQREATFNRICNSVLEGVY